MPRAGPAPTRRRRRRAARWPRTDRPLRRRPALAAGRAQGPLPGHEVVEAYNEFCPRPWSSAGGRHRPRHREVTVLSTMYTAAACTAEGDPRALGPNACATPGSSSDMSGPTAWRRSQACWRRKSCGPRSEGPARGRAAAGPAALPRAVRRRAHPPLRRAHLHHLPEAQLPGALADARAGEHVGLGRDHRRRPDPHQRPRHQRPILHPGAQGRGAGQAHGHGALRGHDSELAVLKVEDRSSGRMPRRCA